MRVLAGYPLNQDVEFAVALNSQDYVAAAQSFGTFVPDVMGISNIFPPMAPLVGGTRCVFPTALLADSAVGSTVLR